MTWNVLFGGGDRFERILETVRAERPDVLILEECLGWEDGQRLARVADAIGVPIEHAVLGRARPRGSGKRYHVAVVSRARPAAVQVHADPAFLGHCAVSLEVAGLRIIGAHFDAHHENLRFVEARYLRSVADPGSGTAMVLAGDLNSLSPRDPYPPDLAEKVRAAGTDKYGHPPRFEVMRELEAQGWVDALWHLGPPVEWVTARRDRGGVRIDYRTDYVLLSPVAAERLVAARIVAAGEASDHDAVLVELRD
jgi:exodeoxyribonuclease-3